MRGTNRKSVIRLAVGAAIVGLGLLYFLGDLPAELPRVEAQSTVTKSSPQERAKRRAYDGAPPVMAHGNLGMNCTACHNSTGMEVPKVGFAPPSPHEKTRGISAISRCQQCHVSKQTDDVFQTSTFSGLLQDLRKGRRATQGAPPVMPHPVFMRENCLACHSGPAAREAIRTTHSERARCTQCHVEQTIDSLFVRTADEIERTRP